MQPWNSARFDQAAAHVVAGGGGGGGNAVTLDAIGTAFGGGPGTGGLDESLTIASNSNRALIAVFAVMNSVSATGFNVAWDSNAIGGAAQPMTLLINQDAGGGKQVFIFGLRNPRVGNWRFGITWTGSVMYFARIFSLYNVNQASDAAAFPGAVGTNTGGTPNSITVTTGANNWGVAAFSGDPGNVTAVSHTELYKNSTGSSWSVGACHGASSTATMTFTESPGHASAVAAGVCIAHD